MQIDLTHPNENMATEQAIPDVVWVPTNPFIVEEGGPFLRNQLEVCFPSLELGNGPNHISISGGQS